MKQKKIFIILSAVGFIFVVLWAFILVLVVKTLRGLPADDGGIPVAEVTLCNEDASGLCVTHFGANSLNRMLIHFRLPAEDYAAFYVKARNRDTVGVYTCAVDESDLTAVRCTGVRTPLGETVDLEIYITDGDTLIARGMFLVSAIAIPTPLSLPEETPEEFSTEEFPAEEFPTEFPFPTEPPFLEEAPTQLPEDFPDTDLTPSP
jgi:hypothetical protein